MDAEFFEAFAVDGLRGGLTGVDMSADEVPAVGVPAARRVAVAQERETLADQECDRDVDQGGVQLTDGVGWRWLSQVSRAAGSVT